MDEEKRQEYIYIYISMEDRRNLVVGRGQDRCLVGFPPTGVGHRWPVYLRPGYTFAFVHDGHSLLEFACHGADEIYSPSPL